MQITEGLLAVGEVEAPAIVKSLVAQGSALPAVGIKTVTSHGVVGQAMNSVGQAMNSLALGGASGGSAVAVKGVSGGVTKGLGFFGLGLGAWGQVLLIGATIALGVGVCNYLYRGGAAGWRKVTEEIPEE
ncbi:MAG: hypothetical protein H7836_03175 [Magnetococcus sp. YQC-3]